MLEVELARQKILEATSQISKCETTTLEYALNRVLAEDIISPINVPPADNSAMDGYAVVAHEVDSVPCKLPISQRIPAGTSPKKLQKETAARIFTGAEIPENADAVVIQENCESDEEGRNVTILKKPEVNQNIRPSGQDIASGSKVFEIGHRLQPQHIGLLASVGIDRVKVFRRIRVAVLSTGSELVEPGKPLKPGQIYNSNQFMLNSLLTKLGCEIKVCQIVHDDFESTQNALKEGAETADIIVSSGGVSVGEEDHVKDAVSKLGELNLWKVNVKPGKPLAFGNISDTPFLGLPGNPVSAYATFLLFGVPLIKKLQGQSPKPLLSFQLPANFESTRTNSRPEYMRVQIHNQKVDKFTNQSSGVLSSLSWANALALIPANTSIAPGDLIEVFPLDLLTA